MRRMTILLFQLFLAIFAGYAVIYHVPIENLLVPLTCLVTIFFVLKQPLSIQYIIVELEKPVFLSSII